jgi:mRNA-degrading endonuclease toxin of MazEF toxin-antitoxin module
MRIKTFQTRSVSLERFAKHLGVLEGELLKDVALALSMVIEEN